MPFTNSPATLILWMGVACVGAAAAKKAYEKYKKTNKYEVKNEDNETEETADTVSDLKAIFLQSPVIQWVLAMALPKKAEPVTDRSDQSEKSESSDNDDSDNDADDENENELSKEAMLESNSFEMVSGKGFDTDKQGLEDAPYGFPEKAEPVHQVPPTDDLSSLISDHQHEDLKAYEEKVEKIASAAGVELGSELVKSDPSESETVVDGFEADAVGIETTEVDGSEINKKVRDLKVRFEENLEESKSSDNELSESFKDENFSEIALNFSENAETSYDEFTSTDFQSIEPLPPTDEIGSGEVDSSTAEINEVTQESQQNEAEIADKLEKPLEDPQSNQEKTDEKESLSSGTSEFSVLDVEKEIDQDNNYQSLDLTSDTSFITLPEETEKSRNDSIPEVIVPPDVDETSPEESSQQENLDLEILTKSDDDSANNHDEDPEDETQNKPHLQDILQDVLSESSKEATKADVDEQQTTNEEESLADKAQNLIKQTVTDICVAIDELVEDSAKQLSPDADDTEKIESPQKNSSTSAKEEIKTSEQLQSPTVQEAAKTQTVSPKEVKESPLNFFGTLSMQVATTPCQMHVQMMIVHTGSQPNDVNLVIEDMDKCNFSFFIKSLENFNLKSKTKIYIKTILTSASGVGRRKMKTPLMKSSTTMEVNKAMEFEKVPWKTMNGNLEVSIWTNTTLGGKKKIGNVDIKLGKLLGFGKNKGLTVRELLSKKKGSWIDISFDFK